MPITLLDNFNRADGALGSNWASLSVGGSSMVVASNQAKIDPGAECADVWIADSFADFQEVEVTLAASRGVITTDHLYLFFQTATLDPVSFTGYILDHPYSGTNGSFAVYVCNSGSYTQVGSSSDTFGGLSNGDVIGVRKHDRYMSFLVNGIQQYGVYHDTGGTPLLSGDGPYIGMGGRDAGALRVDNFSGQELVLPTTGTASASVLDNFNRADGSLGSNWSLVSFGTDMLDVIGNKCSEASSTSYSNAVWNVGTFGPDCEVEATISPGTHFGDQYLLLQVDPSSLSGSFTGYAVSQAWENTAPATLLLERWNAGVATLLGRFNSSISTSGRLPAANDDVITLRKIGSMIAFLRNGYPEMWIEDPAPLTTPGYAGLAVYNGGGFTFDDFRAGTISSGSLVEVTLSASTTATPTYTRAVTTSRTASGVGSVTVPKNPSHTLSASASLSSTYTATLNRVLSLLASGVGTATLTRQVEKVSLATAVSVNTVNRAITRTVSLTSTAVPVVRKTLSRIYSTTASHVASFVSAIVVVGHGSVTIEDTAPEVTMQDRSPSVNLNDEVS